MKSEDLVCSLELAKKLDELGVKQKSLFYWTYSNMFGNETHYLQYFEPIEGGYDEEAMVDDIPAYTVAELGEMLNNISFYYKGSHRLERHFTYKNLHISFNQPKKYWFCYITNDGGYTHVDSQSRDENLANALAKLLSYLLEKKLIDVKMIST